MNKLVSGIIFLVSALLPVAATANVLYDFNNNYISFVAPDFITNLPATTSGTGFKTWTLYPTQFASIPCPIPGVSVCSTFDLSVNTVTETSTYALRAYDPFEQSFYTYALGVFPSNLAQTGTFSYGPGNGVLSIQFTNAATTYAPEPASWLMILLTGALVLVGQARRLSQRAVWKEPVGCSAAQSTR